MKFNGLKKALSVTYNAASRGTKATFGAVAGATVTSAKFTAKMTGKGIDGTFYAIEKTDEALDKMDQAFEDAAAYAIREPIGLINKDAKPHADRVGRIGYKAGKIAVSLTGLPAGFRTVTDAISAFRRK